MDIFSYIELNVSVLLHTGLSLSRVIARHTTESWLGCGQRCIRERSCVGFNFNDRFMNKKDRQNCELTDERERPEPNTSKQLNKDSNWKYYQGFERDFVESKIVSAFVSMQAFILCDWNSNSSLSSFLMHVSRKEE